MIDENDELSNPLLSSTTVDIVISGNPFRLILQLIQRTSPQFGGYNIPRFCFNFLHLVYNAYNKLVQTIRLIPAYEALHTAKKCAHKHVGSTFGPVPACCSLLIALYYTVPFRLLDLPFFTSHDPNSSPLASPALFIHHIACTHYLYLNFMGNKRSAEVLEDTSTTRASKILAVPIRDVFPRQSQDDGEVADHSNQSFHLALTHSNQQFPNPLGGTPRREPQASIPKVCSLPYDAIVNLLKKSDLRTIMSCLEVSRLFNRAASEVIDTYRTVSVIDIVNGLGPCSALEIVKILNRLPKMDQLHFDGYFPSPHADILATSSKLFCDSFQKQNLCHVVFIAVPVHRDSFLRLIDRCNALHLLDLACHDSIDNSLADSLSEYCRAFSLKYDRPRFRLFRLTSATNLHPEGMSNLIQSCVAHEFHIQHCPNVRSIQVGPTCDSIQVRSATSLPNQISITNLSSMVQLVISSSINMPFDRDLTILEIVDCPTLQRIAIHHLMWPLSLKKIAIRNCPRLHSFVPIICRIPTTGLTISESYRVPFANLVILDLSRVSFPQSEVIESMFGICSGTKNALPHLEVLVLKDVYIGTLHLNAFASLKSLHVSLCPCLTKMSVFGCDKIETITLGDLAALKEAYLHVPKSCKVDGVAQTWKRAPLPCGQKMHLSFKS